MKLNGDQKRKALELAKTLFPEYSSITIEGEYFRFAPFRKNTLSSVLLPKQVHKIHIFEAFMRILPSRLSKYAYGNESFIPLYLANMVYILTIDPQAIVDYLWQKYKSIRSPYNSRWEALQIVEQSIREEDGLRESMMPNAFRSITKLRDRKKSTNMSRNEFVEDLIEGNL